MKNLTLFFFLLICGNTLNAQFDVDAYKQYLSTHKDMSFKNLIEEYPAGNFLKEAPTDFMKSEYAEGISSRYNLTAYETGLINKHGFMVSERLSYPSFIHAFWDIFKNDMPVYISSDAMLHALHYSFNKILMIIEEYFILPNLEKDLTDMKFYLSTVSTDNKPESYLMAMKDLDVYLSVTQSLLVGESNCLFTECDSVKDEILEYIADLSPQNVALFSEASRLIDFSQFTVRGHYTLSKKLSKYFQAMTWLGRTEIFITNPENEGQAKHSDTDLQRMAVLSALIGDISQESGAIIEFNKIDKILTFLLGRQDNISLNEVIETLDVLNYSVQDLADTNKCKIYRNKLCELSSAKQLYTSQILFSDITDPKQIKLPSTFLLMGQRPIIDGFITANVVYDRIMFEGNKVLRVMPSTLDLMFALGNDASIQLLEKELNKYPYSTNLAALRYLVDSYDTDFWQSSVYTCWLNGIRSLNPPLHRENLPPFMQTAAWWQKTMNTQLASWAELRHDFLLYAKQPYTDSYVCSFPYGYVEPVPQFYDNCKTFFSSLQKLINSPVFANDEISFISLSTFSGQWMNVCDTLKSISNSILENKVLSEIQNNFISRAIRDSKLCDINNYRVGWYPELYLDFNATDMEMYKGNSGNKLQGDDFIVADVHTIPTDENENFVGWVLHAGTGKINMAVITAPTPEGGTRSYIGPVFSYYEFVSKDFERLTDEDWRKMDGAPAYRPAFTNLYLADKSGNTPAGEKISLYSYLSDVKDIPSQYENNLNLSCTPNPFTNLTIINFTIPDNLAELKAELSIYDLEGNLIKSLIDEKLHNNNYSVIWDGTDNKYQKASTGTYIYSIKIADKIQSGKISLIK